LFLSKAEFDYLTANRQFSDDYGYTIKCRLHKKIELFASKELPLLIRQGYLDLTEFCKIIENCKESIAKVGQADGASALEDNYSNCTVRSSITGLRGSPAEMEKAPSEMERSKKEMLRPGFEPGISDSKGRYA
jgi:hypothetical protein